MGKRRAEGEGGSHRKHKKNKHKKKAKGRDENEGSRVVETQPGGRPLTLKIKLGRKPPAESDEEVEGEEMEGEEVESEEVCSVRDSCIADSSVTGREGTSPPSDPSFTTEDPNERGMEDGEDEEAWLVAMEKGQLDETGYLPRRPGSSLTARQKAMLGSSDGQLLELPLGKATKEMTEEMILKKTEKNRKRRQAAQRRKEKRKAETVRKLLEKQSKKKEEGKPTLEDRVDVSSIHYIRSQISTSISLPLGVDFPLATQHAAQKPPQRLCAVRGCGQPRKYCDSVSGLALCSLSCYKTLHRQHHNHP